MKEIIVVENKAFLNKTDFVCIEDIVKDLKVEYKIEQVPETWEELKELCEGITVDVTVCKDGTVYCYEHCIAKNRTPAQMWQIIKSLIGEEK